MSRKKDNPPIDTAFEVAANPLNSLNPPPRDLPDLIDKLLSSDAALSSRIEGCNQVAYKLRDRLFDLRDRRENLRQRFPQWRSDNPQKLQGPKDKHRLAFESQEAIFTRMISQVDFLSNFTLARLPLRLMSQRSACEHVFAVFLGDHHDHRGIEIANSAHLHCVDGCRWYFEHGPYEWSKKPFSNQWWAEMNHTDWDWVKVRKHIEDLVTSINSTHVRAADDFQHHFRKFMPAWFWEGEINRWGLRTRFRVTEDRQGAKRIQTNVFIVYSKTQYEEQRELAQVVAAMIKQREQEGVENPSDFDTRFIPIQPVGTCDIDNKSVFDGVITVDDWDLAVSVPQESWLKHWGYVDRT